MRVHYSVAADTHDALKTAATEIAAKYAGDLEHTVDIGHVRTEWRTGKNGAEVHANDDPHPRFVAACSVDVADAELDAQRARSELDERAVHG